MRADGATGARDGDYLTWPEEERWEIIDGVPGEGDAAALVPEERVSGPLHELPAQLLREASASASHGAVVQPLTGLGERTGRRFLASLLHYGLLTSETSRSPVSFAIPFQSLRFLFPELWPEAEVDTYDSPA